MSSAVDGTDQYPRACRDARAWLVTIRHAHPAHVNVDTGVHIPRQAVNDTLPSDSERTRALRRGCRSQTCGTGTLGDALVDTIYVRPFPPSAVFALRPADSNRLSLPPPAHLDLLWLPRCCAGSPTPPGLRSGSIHIKASCTWCAIRPAAPANLVHRLSVQLASGPRGPLPSLPFPSVSSVCWEATT